MKLFYAMVCAASGLLLAAGSASASSPSRSTSAIGSGMKTINSQPHFQRMAAPAQAPILRAAEEGITVPFTHSLGKKEDANTIYNNLIDANDDAKTWKPGGFTDYSVCMKGTGDTMDDWMFSPAIVLQAGQEYEISLDVCCVLASGKMDLLDLYIGTSQTIEGMTQLVNAIEITNTKSSGWKTSTATFTVEADGLYYVGFHAKSNNSESGNIGVCNLSMKALGGEEEKIDPPAAGTLTYEVYPKGELKAHVVYTAPTLTQSGAPLEAIAKVEIINRWYEKFEYTDVAPGQVIELDVDLFSGMSNNRLQATAYVTDSKGNLVAGEELLVTGIMAGPDYPLAPENVHAVLSADRKHVTVSWDPVGETGENGGYVDPSAVTYYIFDAFGSYYDPALAETTETSFTFDYSDATAPDFIAYQVTAGYDNYYSLEGVSEIITYGPALEMPFKESFADGYYESVWVTDLNSSKNVMVGTVDDTSLQTNADDPDAEPQYLTSQDGDNGFFYFLPMEKDDLYGMMSLPVSIEGAINPVLQFYAQGKGSVIDVMVGPSLPEMKVVETIDFMENPTEGWTPFTVSLAEFAEAGAVNFELRMRAIHNDDEHTWSLPIDNIRVRDLVDNNLAISSFNVPASIKVGEAATITARIENLGAKTSEATVARLLRDDALISEQPVAALDPNGSAIATFTDEATIADPDQLCYKIILVNDNDMLPDDNSAQAIAKVIFPAHPKAEGLAANITDNTVNLTWNHVSLEGLTDPEAVEEDFENPDYEPLTISDFGKWTMVDLDGAYNYTFLKDENNPYRSEPCAYQLFNPETAGVPEDYLIDCQPHSGNTMLVGWSTDGQNANLLISPELSGAAQTVTFWAKSFSIAYGEEFTVYTSSTGKAISDFTKFSDVEGETISGSVPEDWTEYTLSLPEGTKYFAILHDSYDTYAIYLDDFSFEQAPELPADTRLIGYNVYRDGVKITETPVEENSYSDLPELTARTALINYQVSAVYTNAESRLSEPVAVDASLVGIENVTIDNIDAEARYYGIDGRQVPVKDLAPGLYIRVKGNSASKISLR